MIDVKKLLKRDNFNQRVAKKNALLRKRCFWSLILIFEVTAKKCIFGNFFFEFHHEDVRTIEFCLMMYQQPTWHCNAQKYDRKILNKKLSNYPWPKHYLEIILSVLKDNYLDNFLYFSQRYLYHMEYMNQRCFRRKNRSVWATKRSSFAPITAKT